MKGYITKEGNLSLTFHEKRDYQGLLHGQVNGLPLIVEQTLIRPILPWEQRRKLTMAQLAPAIIKEAKKAIKNNKEEWVRLEGFPYIGILYFEKREIIVAKY
jgi:hypothetical protein